ncbi:CU044_2847 family protein [Streptomyces niger]|uniref:CU044_2847 family protein n=1 Tax=Streptomyces niger TaxID=66373 RepID=UPI00069B208F|nr:CU044_2847 family protein [Streptomyces niger]
MNIVELPLENGGTVAVEWTGGPPADMVTRGMSVQAAAERAEQTFEASLGTVRTVAETVLAQLDGLRARPETVTVEFGVALAARVGAVVTAGADAHLQVCLTWQAGSQPAATDAGTR